MIDRAHIKKMMRDVLRHEQGLHDQQLVHPIREWMGGILVVCGAVLAGGGMSFFLYETTSSSSVADEAVNVPTIPYQTAIIASANEKYASRRDAYDTVRGRAAAAVTPPVVPIVTTTQPVSTTTLVATTSSSATPADLSELTPQQSF